MEARAGRLASRLCYAAAMPSSHEARPAVTIVGPGRWGSVLAFNLHRAGWKVESLVLRPLGRATPRLSKLARQIDSTIQRLDQSPSWGPLVWLTVPDDAIAGVAAQLTSSLDWQGATTFHSSGALTSDALSALRKRGAHVAAVHPGMTFVSRAAPSLTGVPFGTEGDAPAVRLARRVVTDLGGIAVVIRKRDKVLYHAFDTFASPLLVALMAAMEEVGIAAGIRKPQLRTMAGTLLQQTLTNYLAHGAAKAFSGPFIRGDVATVRQHLQALRRMPAAREAYLALARVALKDLPVRNSASLKRVLR
jgi:predicted short-subunit dehydrogenase-like oxidoreductase (DUF2520 family)